MRTIIFLIIINLYTIAVAQNSNMPVQLHNSLPKGWQAAADSLNSNQVIIRSPVIELIPDMTTNDKGPDLKGVCEIFILITERVAPDSIILIRERNKKLKNNLPAQNSKNNLGAWYQQNETVLKILDSEPTHYDKKYSYRIKCSRIPKNQKELAEYNTIIDNLDRQFTKYKN